MTDIVVVETVAREILDVSGAITTSTEVGENTYVIETAAGDTVVDKSQMESSVVSEGMQGPPGASSVPAHDGLTGLNSGDYMHLTAAQYAALIALIP